VLGCKVNPIAASYGWALLGVRQQRHASRDRFSSQVAKYQPAGANGHNSSLSHVLSRNVYVAMWLQGEESVKERFTLDEGKVVPFLEQDYTLEQVTAWGGGEGGLGVWMLGKGCLPWVKLD